MVACSRAWRRIGGHDRCTASNAREHAPAWTGFHENHDRTFEEPHRNSCTCHSNNHSYDPEGIGVSVSNTGADLNVATPPPIAGQCLLFDLENSVYRKKTIIANVQFGAVSSGLIEQSLYETAPPQGVYLHRYQHLFGLSVEVVQSVLSSTNSWYRTRWS